MAASSLLAAMAAALLASPAVATDTYVQTRFRVTGATISQLGSALPFVARSLSWTMSGTAGASLAAQGVSNPSPTVVGRLTSSGPPIVVTTYFQAPSTIQGTIQELAQVTGSQVQAGLPGFQTTLRTWLTGNGLGANISNQIVVDHLETRAGGPPPQAPTIVTPVAPTSPPGPVGTVSLRVKLLGIDYNALNEVQRSAVAFAVGVAVKNNANGATVAAVTLSQGSVVADAVCTPPANMQVNDLAAHLALKMREIGVTAMVLANNALSRAGYTGGTFTSFSVDAPTSGRPDGGIVAAKSASLAGTGWLLVLGAAMALAAD